MPVKYIRRADGQPGVPPQDTTVTTVVAVGAAQIDGNLFTADRDYELVKVSESHSVAGAGSTTLDIKKCTGTTAPASGTTMLSSTFAIDSTANTPVTKTPASGLAAAQATRRVASGDRIASDWTGTVTAYIGQFTLFLRPIEAANDPTGF